MVNIVIYKNIEKNFNLRKWKYQNPNSCTSSFKKNKELLKVTRNRKKYWDPKRETEYQKKRNLDSPKNKQQTKIMEKNWRDYKWNTGTQRTFPKQSSYNTPKEAREKRMTQLLNDNPEAKKNFKMVDIIKHESLV